jgi:GT2 family glycosyltransferase
LQQIDATATPPEVGNPPGITPVPKGIRRPFWSVMIPVYNPGDYLKETLLSVLAQAPGPEEMEIEVVDNCSTRDDPEPLVRAVGGGRVRFHRHPSNLGAIENFNSCIERAHGTWVHVLHGDDTVRPGFYTQAREAARAHPDLAAIACRVIYIDGDGVWMGLSELETRKAGVVDEDFVRRQLLEQRIQFAGMVVKRSAYEEFGAFRPELKHCADWDMWNRIIVQRPVYYTPEALACYRLHGAADSAHQVRTGENVIDERRAIRLACTYVRPEYAKGLHREAMRMAAIRGLRRVRTHMTLGQRDVALRQLQEAFRCSVAPGVMARLLYVLAALIEKRGEAEPLVPRLFPQDVQKPSSAGPLTVPGRPQARPL